MTTSDFPQRSVRVQHPRHPRPRGDSPQKTTSVYRSESQRSQSCNLTSASCNRQQEVEIMSPRCFPTCHKQRAAVRVVRGGLFLASSLFFWILSRHLCREKDNPSLCEFTWFTTSFGRRCSDYCLKWRWCKLLFFLVQGSNWRDAWGKMLYFGGKGMS